VHEASYLPFLYSPGDEDSENVTSRIPNLGRRFFNRHDEDKVNFSNYLIVSTWDLTLT